MAQVVSYRPCYPLCICDRLPLQDEAAKLDPFGRMKRHSFTLLSGRDARSGTPRTLVHMDIESFAEDTRSPRERMLAGDLYVGDDELAADRLRALALSAQYNATAAADCQERRRLLTELLGSVGQATEIRAPLYCGLWLPDQHRLADLHQLRSGGSGCRQDHYRR